MSSFEIRLHYIESGIARTCFYNYRYQMQLFRGDLASARRSRQRVGMWLTWVFTVGSFNP